MKRIGLLGATLALVACGSADGGSDTDGDGTVSRAEMDAAIADADEVKPEPGKYRVNMEVTDVDLPGAPEQVVSMLRSNMNRAYDMCITPAEAENGFRDALNQQEGCEVQRFAIDGGDIDMAMVCDQAGAGMEFAMTGEVTPTTSDLDMTMKGNAPGMGEMTMAMNYTQERVGECDGTEET